MTSASDFHRQQAQALNASGRSAEAATAARRAISIDPSDAEAWFQLGTALKNQGQLDSAISVFRQVTTLKPDSACAFNDAGTALQNLGKIDQAIQSFRQAVAVSPDWALPHFNLGLLLLLKGDFENGWPHYEWRDRAAEAGNLVDQIAGPRWDGGDLHDRTLLLHAEQGLGDAIQFIRYAALVSQKCPAARILFRCHSLLIRLLTGVDGISRIVSSLEPPPPFDVHCPLLSLPAIFKTRLDTIPACVPYIRAESTLSKQWRTRLSGIRELKIGLAWAGRRENVNDHNRSLPVDALRPLEAVHGIALYSLQKSLPGEQNRQQPQLPMVDWTPELTDLSDTAALIDNLDLVISADTAVAHLAGAMGKRVWLLLPFWPDWRWMLDRGDSPWYPMTRLFRQPTPGDWNAVLQHVVQALGKFKINPNMSQLNVAQLMDQAVRHHQGGRLAQAEQLYRQILTMQPNHADAMHLLGVIAYQIRQYEPAIESITRAISLKPTAADFYCNLGNVYQDTDRVDEAIAAFQKAIELRPNFFEAHNNLANALILAGRLDEAIITARQAIKVNPKYPQAYNSLGTALRKKGLPDESIAALRKALSLKPNYAEAFNNLGNAYRDQYKLELAIQAFRSAASLKPELAEIHNNLAGAYEQLGLYDQAISLYRKAVSLPTAMPDAHVNLGIALLREGNFAEGWDHYQWRWRGKDFRREFTQPQWDGADLNGKRILIHAEQGLGDTIQFSRYLPAVVVRGGRIIVQCQRELIRLLQQIGGIEAFISQEDADPDFDVHCSFLSLPRVLGTTLETIPRTVPWLRADSELSQLWRERISRVTNQKANVGLVWAGRPEHKNDLNRSMCLTDLAPLAQVQGTQFHSLQKGPAAEQLQNPPPGLNIVNWADQLNDFSDTAALMDNLDMIVSVDTAPAHLAGAMGKPILLLLSFVPDCALAARSRGFTLVSDDAGAASAIHPRLVTRHQKRHSIAW